MRAELEHKAKKEWLCIPYEYEAPVISVTVSDKKGREKHVPVRLAESRVDLWMSYPLTDLAPGRITLSAEGENWLGASYIGMEPAREKRRETPRPRVHYMPPSGGITSLEGIWKQNGRWILSYTASPCMLEDVRGAETEAAAASVDLLHWEETQTEGKERKPEENRRLSEVFSGGRAAEKAGWTGDVEEAAVIRDGRRIYSIARSFLGRLDSCAGACVLSIPAQVRDGKMAPASQTENLRVWERIWQNVGLEKEFYFPMRFKLAPGIWPEIRLLEKENTADDIRTEACEAEVEIFVGQERELSIELCGAVWRWEALEQTISCGSCRIKAPVENGRLHLHFFSDMVVQELFPGTDRAALILLPGGMQKKTYRIGSELVENINNDSFCFQYPAEPYIRINSSGASAYIVEAGVWGLRPVRYSEAGQKLLKGAEKGKTLFECCHYTIYENCVEDRIYGPPCAWALNGGKTVLSPVRAKEEFTWRATPWGDMTRVVNRTERWDAPRDSTYPRLWTKYPVLNAAFGLAADIMLKNRDERYALPGQRGLMNAALFQGEGEGFGSWVRDTCHAAFRCQNLLAPEEIRESLVYISERGFNNGEDCAAMPAVAAWDYYTATGDRQILFEMLPGIQRYAQEADQRYDGEMELVRADMCPAQDAFPEPENGGYCLGTEIFFALMYEAAAKICTETGCMEERREIWSARAAAMRRSIREKYWNPEKGCFTSGPVGSEAYEKGWWEMTGAELALWPRFGIASRQQRKIFLTTIRQNPGACSDFGMNWYPFRREKNHFWRACWVSWTQGVAVAAASEGDEEFLMKLIFGQVRNVLLNKSFHEVMDFDTGKAWRWPHLPWHAAAFIGYIVNGVMGVGYDADGLRLNPLIPEAFADSVLTGVKHRAASYTIYVHGFGRPCRTELDGIAVTGAFGRNMTGEHRIDVYAGNRETAGSGGEKS